jgi:ribosomal protein S18 acetylase RimI-like enzyme
MHASLFVRTAFDSDASQIAQHREASAQEAKSYRGNTRHLSDTGLEISLVGGCGTTVMASLSARVDDKSAVVHHVYVVPESREVGLGDLLIQTLISELRQRGITSLQAQALPGDRAMKNLFERHGLIAQTIIVGKSL